MIINYTVPLIACGGGVATFFLGGVSGGFSFGTYYTVLTSCPFSPISLKTLHPFWLGLVIILAWFFRQFLHDFWFLLLLVDLYPDFLYLVLALCPFLIWILIPWIFESILVDHLVWSYLSPCLFFRFPGIPLKWLQKIPVLRIQTTATPGSVKNFVARTAPTECWSAPFFQLAAAAKDGFPSVFGITAWRGSGLYGS